tara:strand:+ start:1252 stop:1866 length:615 start_codon:yes stop_codon:yes gene_type:complete
MIGKKSFVLYSDLKQLLDKLPDEIAGKLFKMVLDYVNDLDPQTDDLVLQIAFEPIKQQLKRDLLKWEESLAGKSKAGKISAAQRGLFQQDSTGVDNRSTDSTVSVNVSVTDNVNWNKLIEVYNLIYDRKFLVIAEATRKKYRARLKEGYTKKDIVLAMKNAKKDDYHKSTSPPFKYLTLEFFSRPDKIDRFIHEDKPQKYTPTK